MTAVRELLFSIAYRMLGSVAEAEDVVQEAFVRRAAASDVTVENERAFMTTITTRLAIDVLRSARVRRETYVGEWLPEPLVEPEAPARVETDESISLAILVLLERLSPVERAVFVLRESFDFAFDEIASIVERSEDNCRQILTRARRRVADDRPRFDADPAERRTLAARFLAAARDGDLDGLVALLAPEAVLIGDGGGRARAIPRPMVGAPPSPEPSPPSTARSTASPSPSKRSRSTASRASAPSTPKACSSMSSRSMSTKARSPPSTRSSTRTNSPTSARPPSSGCVLRHRVDTVLLQIGVVP